MRDKRIFLQPIQPISKSTLPSLPTAQSLSPKRKLLSDQPSKSKFNSSDKSSEQHRLSFRFGGKDQLGCLTGRSHYLRLYELLKAAHANYRVTLQQEASEMYLGLLNACLQVLSQILEVAGINEAGRVAEEMLHYLQSTVRLSSTKTVQCVRQLLKSLFGTNLSAKWSEIYEAQSRIEKKADFEKGFYEQCFQRPAKLMVEWIKEIGNNCRGSYELDSNRR
jgi:huntingtin